MDELEHKLEKITPQLYETKEEAKDALSSIVHDIVESVVDEIESLKARVE